jgi:hypothetical protein
VTQTHVTQIDREARGQSSAPALGPAAVSTQDPKQRAGAWTKVHGRRCMDEEDKVVARASTKLQEGDIRGAVRCLCSEETLAPSTN